MFTIKLTDPSGVDVRPEKRFSRFAKGIEDMVPLWNRLLPELYALEEKQFATEGKAGGERWKALSEPYRTYKEQRYPGKKILQRTGSLMHSFTDPVSPYNVHRMTPQSLEFGSRDNIAAYHYFGTSRGLPSRKEIQFKVSKGGLTAIDKLVHVWLNERWQASKEEAGFASGAEIFSLGKEQ